MILPLTYFCFFKSFLFFGLSILCYSSVSPPAQVQVSAGFTVTLSWIRHLSSSVDAEDDGLLALPSLTRSSPGHCARSRFCSLQLEANLRNLCQGPDLEVPPLVTFLDRVSAPKEGVVEKLGC